MGEEESGQSIVPSGVLENENDSAYIQLRKELVENQKLIGVIDMPSGIFMASSKKGSASKGAGVHTCFLIFEKTNKGGTDNVWFYKMENDGFTLDAKRNPTEKSDIPDIINRFDNLRDEVHRSRKEKSFMVPVKEIIENNYYLGINKYREIVIDEKKYENPKVIFKKIIKMEDEIQQKLKELEDIL